tara:strand:- start:54 stop:287 length:234 start_codon:yes stop_codon:yes gene_type:complete
MTKEVLEIASEHYAHNHFDMHETNSYKELKRGFEAGAKYVNQVVIEELEIVLVCFNDLDPILNSVIEHRIKELKQER